MNSGISSPNVGSTSLSPWPVKPDITIDILRGKLQHWAGDKGTRIRMIRDLDGWQIGCTYITDDAMQHIINRVKEFKK